MCSKAIIVSMMMGANFIIDALYSQKVLRDMRAFKPMWHTLGCLRKPIIVYKNKTLKKLRM